MARVLDLNSVQRPELELTLMDKDRTTLHVTTPTEALVNELEQLRAGDLSKLETGDKGSVDMIYDLTARLISCNREGINIGPEELRGHYRVDLESLLIVLSAYMEFINDIKNEKN